MLSELIGQGVELLGDQSERGGLRRVLYILSLIIVIYGIIASLFFWRSSTYPQVQGLIQFVQSGGPVWALVAPAALAITLLLLLIPLAGRLSLVTLMAIISAGANLVALIKLQGSSSGITDLPTNFSMFGAFLLVIAVLALAIYDHPKLDAPLAPFALAYWGRLNHLRALQNFGQQQGWQVIGPEGVDNALMVRGELDSQHLVQIISGQKTSLSAQNNGSKILSIVVTSPHDIPGFYCAKKPLGRDQEKGLIAMLVQIDAKHIYTAYIQPYPQFPLTQSVQEQISQIVRSRQSTLPDDAVVQATPVGMRIFLSRYYKRLTARDGKPEAQIQWLTQLIEVLETISPVLSPEELALRQKKYLR
jgi:hypothetical protein